MPNAETRNEKLDLRLTPSAKRTLQIAASVAHCSVSEFVLESALARAEETLPDRQRFGLTAEQWSALQSFFGSPAYSSAAGLNDAPAPHRKTATRPRG